MKNIKFFFYFLVCLCCLTACRIVINPSGSDVNYSVRGSGNLLTEERQVEAFTEIHASRGVSVFIKAGKSGHLQVQADDNLLQYIKTEVTRGALVVKVQDNVKVSSSHKLTVYVSMDKIERLTATSGADIIGKTSFSVNRIQLDATSAGDISMELSARQIQVSMTSGADINLKGSADAIRASLTSGADLNAMNLAVRSCDISLTSGADASVWVKETIAYSLTSGADLKCKGHPSVTRSHVSSGGTVQFY